MKIVFSIAAFLVLVVIGYSIFTQPASRNVAETPNDSGSNQKINLNAICDGALAYMTFPSSAEADVWVQECREGKHPEAVDQWKQRQGITDDRAI